MEKVVFYNKVILRQDKRVMKFDLSRDSAHIAQAWNEIIFDRENNNFSTFYLCGPKGCGKTKAALELARSNARVFYISF